ncbi:MAG: MBL fold metallo-hydrolase, partial [Nitratireductor sp.]
MIFTRRDTLKLGAAGLVGLGATTLVPFHARAQVNGDSYDTDSGKITVHPIAHASFVMTVPGLVIYNDPVGGAEAYQGRPAPDLILITHEHGDHYNVETLEALVQDGTRLITNPAVFDMLPDDLKARATAIGNGQSTDIGALSVDAVPAYNTTEARLKYHP